MSLDFNLTRIANHESVCFENGEDGESRMRARTDSLIWATMFLGLDRITAENCEEFYTRIRIYERLFGAIMVRTSVPTPGEAFVQTDVPCTLEDIKQHIGLRTNADSMTPLQFDRKICERLRRETKAGMQ